MFRYHSNGTSSSSCHLPYSLTSALVGGEALATVPHDSALGHRLGQIADDWRASASSVAALAVAAAVARAAVATAHAGVAAVAAAAEDAAEDAAESAAAPAASCQRVGQPCCVCPVQVVSFLWQSCRW